MKTFFLFLGCLAPGVILTILAATSGGKGLATLGCLSVGVFFSLFVRASQPQERRIGFTVLGVLYLACLILYGGVYSCAAAINRAIG